MKKAIIYFCLLTLIIGLVGCGSANKTPGKNDAAGTQKNENQESLEELAKKEGKVVYYGASPKSDMDLALQLFTKKYGVQVEYIQLRGGELVEKVKTESRAKKNIADLINNGPTSIWELKKEGFLAKYVLDGSEKVLGNDPDGYFFGTTIIVYGILINTKMVPEEKIPKSWNDLLDPFWKGKIVSDDPRIDGGANSIFSILMEDTQYGEEYLKKLAQQKITFSRQNTQMEDSVARGEYGLYIPGRSKSLIRLKGTDAKWIGPQDLTPYLYISTGVAKDAPHPNAARLLAKFLISQEAQKVLATQSMPALQGIDAPIKEMDVSTHKMVTQSDNQLSNKNDFTQKLMGIFKQ